MQILVPKFQELGRVQQMSLERQIKLGTNFDQMLARERHYTRKRILEVGRQLRNYERPKGSELELTGVIDPRTYFRWLATDPHFFDDPGNWKRFVRDNPEVQPWKA